MIFSSISITTSANVALGLGTTYGVPTGLGAANFFDAVVALPAAGQHRLLFDLVAPMTNAGGTINLNIGFDIMDLEGTCTSDGCGAVSPRRDIVAGAISTAVDEPARWSLVAAGLVVLGAARRSRTHGQARPA